MLKRFLGHRCKIIAQESSDEKPYSIIGYIHDIDLDDGFVIIESPYGFCCLNINTILAIKPRNT